MFVLLLAQNLNNIIIIIIDSHVNEYGLYDKWDDSIRTPQTNLP